MPAFSSAADLKGHWRTLFTRLLAVPLCELCDQTTKEREALAIINAISEAMDALKPFTGCIETSQLVVDKISGVPGAIIETGNVNGSMWGGSLFGTTTTRTWMRVSTHCFVIEMVAWWRRPWWTLTIPFRHQAVMITSRCSPDYADPKIPIIDLWWLRGGLSLAAQPIWESYEDWAHGKDRIGKYAGRVEDGF